MTIEELNDILEFTASELASSTVRYCLPQDTPAEIYASVGKILQQAAEKIRKLAKGDDKPEELTAWESQVIARCEQYGLFSPLDNGYQCFWADVRAFYPSDLRLIADELDRRNAKWDGQVRNDMDAEGKGM